MVRFCIFSTLCYIIESHFSNYCDNTGIKNRSKSLILIFCDWILAPKIIIFGPFSTIFEKHLVWKWDIFRQFSNTVLIIKPQLWRASYESFIHCFAMQPNPIFHHLVRRSQKPQKIQFWLNFACDINHYYCSCHTGVEVYCRDKYQRVFSKYFYPCRKASACDWREEKMSVLCALKKTVRPLTLYKKCAPIWNVLKKSGNLRIS